MAAFSFLTLHGPLTVLAVFVELAVLAGLGRAVFRDGPSYALPLGWAVLSLVVTVAAAGFSVPVDWAYAASFLGLLAAPKRVLAGFKASPLTLACTAVAAVVLVMLACIGLSGTDSYWFWLPNATFLVDHGHFPRAGDPGLSALAYPAFPFAFQYLLYGVARLLPYYPQTALVAANGLLLIWYATFLAGRVAAEDRTPGFRWGLAATCVLAATSFNPTLLVLTSYGDLSTSIVLAVAVLSICERYRRAKAGDVTAEASPGPLATGLLLALLINIKQPNLSLAGITILIALAIDPALRRGGWLARLRALAVLVGPLVVVYAAWRWHVVHDLPAGGENELKPFASWPINRTGSVLAALATALLRKAGYTILLIASLLTVIRELRRRDGFRPSVTAVAAGLVLFIGYNAFLAFIYIAHFDGVIQSAWRYNTQLGPLLIGGLMLHYWPLVTAPDGFGRRLPQRPLTVLALILAWVIPVAAPQVFRTDIRGEGHEHRLLRAIKPMLPEGSRLTVLYDPAGGDPQEFDSQHWLLDAGLKMSTPRRQDLVVTLQKPGAAAAATADAVLAFCASPAALQPYGITAPAGTGAALLTHDDGGGWHIAWSNPHPVGRCALPEGGGS